MEWSASIQLTLVLLSTGCATLTPPPGQVLGLSHSPREVIASIPTQEPGADLPRIHVSLPGSKEPEPRYQAWTAPVEVRAEGSDTTEREARRRALATQLAFRQALLEASGSIRRISSELNRLKSHGRGLATPNDILLRYVDYGSRQLRWIDDQLVATTRMATTASEMEEPAMQLALLRVAGPRLEAAMVGTLLLATWLDVLNLAHVALAQRLYSTEALFADMWRWQDMLDPAMKALSSREHRQMEAAAQDVPLLLNHLAEEFAATVERMRLGAQNIQKVLVFKEALETATLFSTMRLSLPALTPSPPALVGIGLVAGNDGLMMGTRMVVSAEWVKRMHELVRAGVLALPVVSAAVRIQAGQAMLSREHGELPRGVREALGDGPEVGAMHSTNKAGAGMAEPPRHHVMPKEFREWFEKRGFSGEMDINEFCVEMEQASHEAIHGGGNWRQGRSWPGEWNRMVMDRLSKAETEAGRMLTRNEVLRIVARNMRDYKIPMNFVSGRGR
ncbi:MAG: DUF2380 domain-containing protein [Cystobacter sp.]